MMGMGKKYVRLFTIYILNQDLLGVIILCVLLRTIHKYAMALEDVCFRTSIPLVGVNNL